MSENKKGMTTLENLANRSRPLDMQSIDTSKPDMKQNFAVRGVTGTYSKHQDVNTAQRDASQHMGKMMKFIGTIAVINTITKHHRVKKYTMAEKDIKKLQEAYNNVRTNGQGGRSVEEILLQDRMNKRQKQLEKMQKKWPNLQHPMSMAQKLQAMFSTSKHGISEALRAQTMKGIAQTNTGSDMRAVMAANAVSYIPGTDYKSDSEMLM